MSDQHDDTILYLVRHGEVQNPSRILYGRLPRFTLSQNGFQQAQAAAEFLKDKPIAGVFSSPLLRARKTARKILAPHPHLDLRVSKHLLEIFTEFDGEPLVELEARDWDFYTNVQSPYETPDDIFKRIQKFIKLVKRDYAGKQVVAVTHGDIVGFTTVWAKGLPIVGETKRKLFTQTPGMEYPATASISKFTFHSPEYDEVPVYEYIKPY
jgi:broad specificity phosphatase PhoE